tara:strand:- start:150 stop:275 length:126 start_codon:yes stop_codon:yes gene_type:complete
MGVFFIGICGSILEYWYGNSLKNVDLVLKDGLTYITDEGTV